MKKIFTLILITASLSLSASEKVKTVQNNIKEINTALYTNHDAKKVLKHTLPSIIKMMGGEQKALNTINDLIKKMNYMTLKSFKFPEDPKFFTTNNYEYAIIPTLIHITANGKTIESLNFQVGLRLLNSKHWYYIEGSRVNKQTIPVFLPEFPLDYKLPKFYRKLI